MKETLVFRTGFYNNYKDIDEYIACRGFDQEDLDRIADMTKNEREEYIYEDYYTSERFWYDDVLEEIEKVFNAHPHDFRLEGSVQRWDGTRQGYKEFRTFAELQSAISGYDDIEITQKGTQLHFALCHHDGTHHMQLRKITERGYTKNFGKVCA